MRAFAKLTPLHRICQRYDQPLVAGRLIKRYKRFLADVELKDGSQVTVHCPNSGSMTGCSRPGSAVRLLPVNKLGRKTPFTWQMIRVGRIWVGVNTMLPNSLVARAAQMRALDIFAGALEVRREVKVSAHSRLDLLVTDERGPIYVEVKNVSLVEDGLAIFPDSRTERGAKHLRELMTLKAGGARAAMVYVVQRNDATAFAPAHEIDPQYAELFHQARRAGVAIRVVEARVGPAQVCLSRELPLAV